MKKGVKDEHTAFNALYNTAITNVRQMLNGKVITGNTNVPYRIITRMHEDKDIKQTIDSLSISAQNNNAEQIEALQRKLDSLKSVENN